MDKSIEMGAATQADHQDEDLKPNLHSLEEAQIASAAEHATTFQQALRENWKAALWSAVISLTIVMEGYDQRFVLLEAFVGFLFEADLFLSWLSLA